MTFERGEAWWTSRGLAAGGGDDRLVVRDAAGQDERAVTLPELPLVDWAGSLSEFAGAVRDGREPESSGRENLGTLALTLAAVESADRGVPVDCPVVP
jgi:predicted dehydrogenase